MEDTTDEFSLPNPELIGLPVYGVTVRVFRDGGETVVEVESGGKPVVVRMAREAS